MITTLSIPNFLLVKLIFGRLSIIDIANLFKYNPEVFELRIICRFLDIKAESKKVKKAYTKVNFPMEVLDVARLIKTGSYGSLNYNFTFDLTKELFFDIIKRIDSTYKIKKNDNILMIFQDFIRHERFNRIDAEYFVKCIGLTNLPDEVKNYIKIMEF